MVITTKRTVRKPSKTVKKPSTMRGSSTAPSEKIVEQLIDGLNHMWYLEALSPSDKRAIALIVKKVSNEMDFEVNFYQYLRQAGIYSAPINYLDAPASKYYYQHDGQASLAKFLWKNYKN